MTTLKHTTVILVLLMLTVLFPGKAQDADTTYWKKSTSLGLNFSQIKLHNWAGGGQSAISLSGISNTSLTYNRERVNWINTLDIGYGLVRLGGRDSEFRKSDDKIILTSKYSISKNPKLKYSALFDLRTQMAPGYNYAQTTDGRDSVIYVSNFFAPAYTVFALGATYSPHESFYLFVSPLTNKNTIVADRVLSEQGAFGVDPGSRFRKELGAYLTAKYSDTIVKNVILKSDLNMFANYSNLETIDISWETQVIMKVNKYLSVNFVTQLIYDDDIDVTREDGTKGPALQVKEVLAVGLSFLF
ncbi:MAG TPA: DUF3078 domain-containing protein [Cytophagaceae bacterium]